MELVRTVPALRERVREWRARDLAIALVPTMGALHAAHDALVREARCRAQRQVVSIFVNPRQFVEGEDFERYPRNENADLRRLEALSVDLVFAPTSETMYPPDFATAVVPGGLALELEGAARDGHFAGVATVVTKLLTQCLPDTAIFGEKDYQQLVVVRRLVRDLDLPSEIVGIPTVREPDGLACSSRNVYLRERERAIAPALFRTLAEAADAIMDGEAHATVERKASLDLLRAGFSSVDYVEIRDSERLEPVKERRGRPARLLAAARLGTIRLIDNVTLMY